MANKDFSQIKTDFEKDGYVFLPGFLGKEEVDDINNKLKEFINDKVPHMPFNHVFYEDNNDHATLKQLQDLHVHDPFFAGILKGSEFEKIAEVLLEEKVIGKNLEYFNKPPKIGKPTPPHQDGYYFMLKPPQAITMWMALENADEENGCVRYIKGSHLKGMRPHGKTQTLGFSQGIIDYGEKDFASEIPFPAKPGDLLIHHAMTIHRADGNKSETRSRKALGFIYFGESAKEDAEAKKAYQKLLSEERLANEKTK
jgi:phytanoyl-CoA hydroxylase